MSSEWYYARAGQSVGPVSLEELRRLADSGELQRTDLVWTSPMREWEEAGGFDELFPPPSGPAPLTNLSDRPAPAAPAARPTEGRYQSRPAQHQGRSGGRQDGRGSRGGTYAPQSQGLPPVVLVGFIISIAGIAICAPISIIGSILCMTGLAEAKRRQEGVGLAIAGIVIGLVVFVGGVIFFILFIAMSGGSHF